VPLPDPTTPGVQLGRNATDTSIAAAAFVLPKSGTQRYAVLMAIAETPRTDDELVQIRGTGVKAGVRRAELVAQGWVEDSGERRRTRNDCMAIVWRLTERGRKELLG
jgi:hypothetical protein